MRKTTIQNFHHIVQSDQISVTLIYRLMHSHYLIIIIPICIFRVFIMILYNFLESRLEWIDDTASGISWCIISRSGESLKKMLVCLIWVFVCWRGAKKITNPIIFWVVDIWRRPRIATNTSGNITSVRSVRYGIRYRWFLYSPKGRKTNKSMGKRDKQFIN